jgi:hydrogenase large subunit
VEAPRGILGHWLRVEAGRIRNYQIVTPTGWNLSPRDCDDRPGPLEAALVGTPVPDPDQPTFMSYVVKSFDPCLFCTVH